MGQFKRGRQPERPPREALRQSVRSRIVCACGERETTPREFADREGLPIERVNYHFRALEKDRFIRVKRRETARGFQRNYYVATRRALISDGEFAQMADDEQRDWSETTLLCFLRRCANAWRAGTFDARNNSHVSWMGLLLDEAGFRELAGGLAVALDFQQEVQAKSKVRLRRTGECPIPTTAALAGFESPIEDAPAKDPAPVFISDEDFARMAPAERRACTAITLVQLLRRCENGLRTGTLDARSDSHLTWVPLLLDEVGFRELTGGLSLMLGFVQEIQDKSLARLERSGENPIPATIGLVAFESPPSDAPGSEEDESR